MKRYVQILLCVVFAASMAFAQTAQIETRPMSPRLLGSYAANEFPIYSGNHTIAKGMKAYLTADTVGGVNTFTWSVVEKPAGSATDVSSTSEMNITFTPDMVGQYVIGLTVNGGSADQDTFTVATYKGANAVGLNCGSCHADIKTKWAVTGHANIFKEGITGQLEVEAHEGQLVGVYNTSCIKCHTTGWDKTADNGNFGYLANQNGFDTTWYQTAGVIPYNGEYLIPNGDMTAWDLLQNDVKYKNAAPVANIGCESCHGTGSEHMATFGNTSKISKTLDAGVCLQCHDAPTHHMVGSYYVNSMHAMLPDGGHTARTGCFPCHSGGGYFKYAENPTNPDWTDADGNIPISCATCHDPHEAENLGLRLVPVSLTNGYTVTKGGNGQLCMTCHQSRSDVATKVTDKAPFYGFSSHYGPHHGPQTDMLFGQNAYQFGNANLTGLSTHAGLENACVTCHMQTRGYNSNHEWTMVDTTKGQHVDMVGVCQTCHGDMTSFDDIKASFDYDGNGAVEGLQSEVRGMLDTLKAHLPKDSNGEVLSGLSSAADSAKIKDMPEVVQGIYTYYFVEEDRSMGVHNAKYTVAILQGALAALGVEVPVELTSFNASVNGNNVNLAWQTVTETNNKGFVVERKTSDKWAEIGFVNGNGTTTELSKYAFVDKNVNVTKASYRLKQVDFDGTFKYSREINVNVTTAPKEFALSQNYPNPFNPSTTIKFALPVDANVKVVIYNVTGEVVKMLTNGVLVSGQHEVEFNASRLSSGVYFYSIEANAVDGSNSFRQTKKMVLMK